MDHMLVALSPAEVLDKITILEIKSERMSESGQLKNVRTELSLLRETWNREIEMDQRLHSLRRQLKEVNEALWQIEDEIRDKERAKQFDEGFIELARSVYVSNDRRSRIKKEVNLHLGSKLIEEKSYREY